jgi:hypothetical protein
MEFSPGDNETTTHMGLLRFRLIIRKATVRLYRAAEQADELSPPHSIASSARASTVWGNFDAERRRGLEIDHQLVLRRRLHRQVGRLLALENAIDVAGRPPVWIDRIRPVGDQAASHGVKAQRVDRGQPMSCRKRYDQFAMKDREPARLDNQAAI